MQPSDVFLGLIALAVVVMAAIQVAAVIAGLRMARRIDELARKLEEDVKPLIVNLTAMSSEAARAASLATTQVERIDRAFGELVQRVDQTLSVAQHFVHGPARQGMAIVAGVRAAVTALRGIREVSRRRGAVRPVGVDEEESLFIG